MGCRICAKPSTKQYGIPSVVFQLYGQVKQEFKIPPAVFFPVPKVQKCCLPFAAAINVNINIGIGGFRAGDD